MVTADRCHRGQRASVDVVGAIVTNPCGADRRRCQSIATTNLDLVRNARYHADQRPPAFLPSPAFVSLSQHACRGGRDGATETQNLVGLTHGTPLRFATG